MIVLLPQDMVLPLCAPPIISDRNPGARDGIDAVPHEDLIHTSWGESFGSHPTWHSWFLKAGLKPPGRGKGLPRRKVLACA